mmetsp:Transcript_4917/g.17551  ORF Transcript_4917/g.17551 Transcript_4917/m.17551 type:complete len:505 (+) Transcript_4917:40-1554(+)
MMPGAAASAPWTPPRSSSPPPAGSARSSAYERVHRERERRRQSPSSREPLDLINRKSTLFSTPEPLAPPASPEARSSWIRREASERQRREKRRLAAATGRLLSFDDAARPTARGAESAEALEAGAPCLEAAALSLEEVPALEAEALEAAALCAGQGEALCDGPPCGDVPPCARASSVVEMLWGGAPLCEATPADDADAARHDDDASVESGGVHKGNRRASVILVDLPVACSPGERRSGASWASALAGETLPPTAYCDIKHLIESTAAQLIDKLVWISAPGDVAFAESPRLVPARVRCIVAEDDVSNAAPCWRLGVELLEPCDDLECGNGDLCGTRHFECPEGRALFVEPDEVTLLSWDDLHALPPPPPPPRRDSSFGTNVLESRQFGSVDFGSCDFDKFRESACSEYALTDASSNSSSPLLPFMPQWKAAPSWALQENVDQVVAAQDFRAPPEELGCVRATCDLEMIFGRRSLRAASSRETGDWSSDVWDFEQHKGPKPTLRSP